MIKEKDRLIAKMVAVAFWGVATFNLVTGGNAGIKVDILQKEVKSLEQQKIECVEQAQIDEIDKKIENLNIEIEKREKFVIPSVFSFVGTGTIGALATSYGEIKDAKTKKKEEQEKSL
jgi:hypothetical protein